MFFQPLLQTGRLLKRYKRFLADIELDDGSVITVHCPNTGSMRSCSTPGSLAAFSDSGNPKRKYRHTLEMVQDNGTWVGVNTSRTNHLVADAIRTGLIGEFTDVENLRQEVKVSDKSRLDIVVESAEGKTFIEVKNCSLAENGVAMFPDAVTTRGTKHLEELMQLVNAGQRACIFFLVQRMDAEHFRPATEVDSVYSETLTRVVGAGVLPLAYQAEVTTEKIEIFRRLPVRLE